MGLGLSVLWITHIFVLICEIGAIIFIDCHDDRHYIFAVHDGSSQDVASGVFCQLVYKRTEVAILELKVHMKKY